MGKRDNKTITIGSGIPYCVPYTEKIMTPEEICVPANLLGYCKGGAALEYAQETYEEKDDLGFVSKIITTSESAKLKLGMLTWNGETLKKLIDRCHTEEKEGKRVTKIGGAGNAQGGYYQICFHHEDKIDGDMWVMIVGRNTAGMTLTYAVDNGTVIEPEFTALPMIDEAGTLVQLIEEIPAAV